MLFADRYALFELQEEFVEALASCRTPIVISQEDSDQLRERMEQSGKDFGSVVEQLLQLNAYCIEEISEEDEVDD